MKIKELLDEALPVINNFAPTIGAAVGGPVGAAVGYILPILSNIFGVNPRDIHGLADKIISDPEAQSKLQSVEKEHGDLIAELMHSANNLTKAEVNINLEWATPTK